VTEPQLSSPSLPQIRVRGRSFMALVLSPEPPLAEWLQGLDAQLVKSASFFAGRPVILDLGLLAHDDAGLSSLFDDLTARGVRIISIEGGDPSWPAIAGWDWPMGFEGGRAVGPLDLPEETHEEIRPATVTSLLIEEPVRSGQSIVYAEGDVIIIGSVASGAEVAAGGSIHIYGTLRGRAVAGLGGNRDARILCRRMNAELIAIDGYYMTAEDMAAGLIGRSTQARLEDETLVLLALD
jgi:septum site-determining protein MinC